MRQRPSGYRCDRRDIDLDRHPECRDLPLVAKVVRDLMRRLPGCLRGLEFADLMQTGYLVLRRCYRLYDPARGAGSPVAKG